MYRVSNVKLYQIYFVILKTYMLENNMLGNKLKVTTKQLMVYF